MEVEYVFTILTIINALFVTFVVFMQYKLSKDKFKLDLFEKRYAVYKATQKFLSKISLEAKIELDDLGRFKAETQDAVFLYKNDIVTYLEDIYSKALSFWQKQENIRDVPIGDERSSMSRELSESFHELVSQLPELKNKFKSYLSFKAWK